jgi:hypothetical protein
VTTCIGEEVISFVLMGHNVGRRGDGEWPFSGPSGRRRPREVDRSDEKVIRNLMGRRGDEKVFDMDRKEGSVVVLG